MEEKVIGLTKDEGKTIDKLIKAVIEKDSLIRRLATVLALTQEHEMEKVVSDDLISKFETKVLVKYAFDYFAKEMPWMMITEEEIIQYIDSRKEELSNDKN